MGRTFIGCILRYLKNQSILKKDTFEFGYHYRRLSFNSERTLQVYKKRFGNNIYNGYGSVFFLVSQ